MKRSPEERAALEAAKLARQERREQLAALSQQGSSEHGAPMPAVPGANNLSTIDVGSEAEQRAVQLLVEHGYEIVERNYRCEVGELDIIASDGDVLAFVEVKSRADDDCGDAYEAVDRRKRRKVTRVAEIYLLERRPDFDEFRFDVVAINGDEVDLYQDAWRGGLL